MSFVKVKWIKSHHLYAYSAGQVGVVAADSAPELVNKGYIIPVPDAEGDNENLLPDDMPGRDQLHKLGFTSVAQVKEAGAQALIDSKISKATVEKIMKFADVYQV